MFLPMHFARGAANRTLMLLAAIALLALPGVARADPPARVARIGYVSGPASFAPAGEDVWIAATLNRPLVTGDQLWSDGGARVELQLGLAAVRLGSNTSLTLLNLDDRVAQFQLTQGTVRLRVRRLSADEVIEIDTPNLAYVIRKPGQYRITVDPVQGSTMVWTGNGQAQAFADGASYLVGAGRAYRFYGNDLGDYEQLAMPGSDEFDRWSQLRDRRDDNSMSSNYVALDVIGYQDLDTYGSWRNVPEYGYVWTPSRVRADWAPYRDGHWSWIEPWGWTWVDDAPWGFTVSHYGRWASINGRWAWIPGPVATQAVYAPALVAFIGGGDFDRLGSSNRASVSWFPLSPRDVYRPAYNVSQKYFTRVNASNTVINASSISMAYDERSQLNGRPGRNGGGPNGNRGNRGNGGNHGDGANRGDRNEAYANQHVPGAVISVPTAAFIQARPVARSAINLPPATLANAPVVDMAAVAPVFTSLQGAAPQGRRPPAATQAQRVVARSAPPPPPAAFSSREKLLAADPGKPIEAPALAAIKPTRSAPVPKVDVLEPARIMNPVAAPPPQPEGSRPRANRDAAPAARQETMRPDALPAAPPPPTPMSAPRNPAGNPAASRDAPMSPRAPVAMQPAPRAPATAPEIAPAPIAAPAAAAPGTGRPARPAPAERDNRNDRRDAAPRQSPPDRQPVAADPRAPMAMPPAAAPPATPAPPRAPAPAPAPRVEPPAAAPAPAAPARAPSEVPRPRIDPPAGARPALPPPPPAAPPPAPTSQDKRGSDAPPQAAPKADNKGGRNDARKDAKKDKEDKKDKDEKKDSETDKEREEKKPK